MYDILKVHDFYIWFASGKISTFIATPALSQGIWLKRLAADPHMGLGGPVIFLNIKIRKTEIELC